MSTENNERKYYFGIHIFHGEQYPAAWVEDNGIPVGGHPKILDGSKREITFEEWETFTLDELGRKYGLEAIIDTTHDPP